MAMATVSMQIKIIIIQSTIVPRTLGEKRTIIRQTTKRMYTLKYLMGLRT